MRHKAGQGFAPPTLPGYGDAAPGPALFLISASSVAYETALTRTFAVSMWSEYGYWIISIVMAGLALSGVVVALARAPLLRWHAELLAWLPAALIGTAALGYWAATGDRFNPLQLQNAVTWPSQLLNIGLYYVYLLPFFFLTGLYISLTFVLNPTRVGTVYGFDLTGAGAGALLVLGLMRILHPFALVPALLVILAASALPVRRWRVTLGAAAVLAGSEALLLIAPHAAINEFKAIYAPSHVPGSRVLATVRAPRGLYTLLDDFTERVDTDISNNAALLHLPGPPAADGMYRDGNRIAALPKRGPADVRYAPATLAALPYFLHPHATVLLAGPSGGFRIAEALALGARTVTAIEPDPVLRAAERQALAAGSPVQGQSVRLLARSPMAEAGSGRHTDIIDISGDFLDEAEVNAHAFTVEALTAYLGALNAGGMLSIPVSIREFPAYAVRMLATVRAALLAGGVADPASHVVVLRSAWNVRILVRPQPWSAPDIARVRAWADDRSFDVPFFPGIDVVAARAALYNDLPAVSFERGEVTSPAGTASDAVADEAGLALAGLPSPSQRSFDLAPITEARPYYYNVLRLTRLPLLLRRIELLPQSEIAPLVNLAVLGQAALLALCVLAVPALARRSALPCDTRRPPGRVRTGIYFAALGLGFLFIEIAAIEKAALLLNDRASAFALVLTAMLMFSGLGSLLSARITLAPHRTLLIATAVIVGWCAGLALVGDAVIGRIDDMEAVWRSGLVLLAMAPVSVALGLPFPLGLSHVARSGDGLLLPWAWAVNGAFSVVATPLANLAALSWGLPWVLFAAIVLYGLSYAVFPDRKSAL